MKRMMSYFGSKWRIAKKYPPPIHDTIIEPFCGSAGYSTHYPHKKIYLYDKNEKVIAVWDYMIHVKLSELRRLPTHIPDLDDVKLPQEVKWMIGFWMGYASLKPATQDKYHKLDPEKKGHWNERVIARLVQQIPRIRHWKAYCKSYEEVPDRLGTWFIDPPYEGRLGKLYPESGAAIDYSDLCDWTLTRPGQVIVCEGRDAGWLPFRELIPLRKIVTSPFHSNANSNKRAEMIWTKNCEAPRRGFGIQLRRQ